MDTPSGGRARSAYQEFAKEQREMKPRTTRNNKDMKTLFDSLSEEEKKTYQDRAQEIRNQFSNTPYSTPSPTKPSGNGGGRSRHQRTRQEPITTRRGSQPQVPNSDSSSDSSRNTQGSSGPGAVSPTHEPPTAAQQALANGTIITSPMFARIRELLNTGDTRDLVLVGHNEVEIAVHSFLLQAMSPVFAGMNFHAENGRVVVDANEEELAEFVQLFYGHDVVSPHCAEKLLELAAQYQIPEVVEQCVEAIASNLLIGKAKDVLELAHALKVEKLKARTLDFIVSRLPQFFGIMGFNGMSTELMAEVIYAAQDFESKKNPGGQA